MECMYSTSQYCIGKLVTNLSSAHPRDHGMSIIEIRHLSILVDSLTK